MWSMRRKGQAELRVSRVVTAYAAGESPSSRWMSSSNLRGVGSLEKPALIEGEPGSGPRSCENKVVEGEKRECGLGIPRWDS
jgi:hypothetical protein